MNFHLVCFALIASASNVFALEKVNVTLYYESLCPYCRNFITDQLKPNYETFKDYIKVELVPYGKTKATAVDDGISFECQHGKSECAENKAHSCGLYLAPNEAVAVQFAACAIESHKINECVQSSGLDQNEYTKCYTSELGTLLQLEAALKTNKLAIPETGMIEFIPTVVYNDVYSKDKAEKSADEFVKVLCEEIQSTSGLRPNGCTSITVSLLNLIQFK